MRRLGDDLGNLALVLFVLNRTGPVDAEVAGRFSVKLRAAFFHGVAQIDDRRQFLVFDLHEVRCVLRSANRLGDHHCDRVSDMHDLFARERRPKRHNHLRAVAARHGRMS